MATLAPFNVGERRPLPDLMGGKTWHFKKNALENVKSDFAILLHASIRYICIGMKSMSIILAIIMLYLTGLPCEDAKIVDIECTAYVQDLGDYCHHGHSTERDGCSPFCICQCCHASVVVPTYYIETSVVVHNNKDNPHYDQHSCPNRIFHSIWRPPQSV